MQCSNEIRPEELLYRVIKRSLPRWAQPFLGDDGYYHLTSAVFKDKNGNSVDRDGGRVEQKVVSFIRDNFGERAKGIARVSAEDCFKVNAKVEPAPTDKNPYHANIFLSGSITEQEMQAVKIADMSNVIYFDEKMSWINPKTGQPY